MHRDGKRVEKFPLKVGNPQVNKLDAWNLVEEELKPQVNKMLSVMRLWSTQSYQGSMALNDWMTKIYNMVEVCEYPVDAKDRMYWCLAVPVLKPKTRF